MTFLMISKCHQNLYPAAIKKKKKKTWFFSLLLFSHFCGHHLPPQLSPERLQHAPRELQSLEQRLRGLQQRPWWRGGGHAVWRARPGWHGRWDDGPERPSHGTVCMQRPWGRVRRGCTQGGELGAAVGGHSRGHALLQWALWFDICLLSHPAECVTASRIECPAMSNKCMMSSAAPAPDLHKSTLPFFSRGCAGFWFVFGYHFVEQKKIHPLWNSYFHNTASRSAVSVALVCVYICSFHVCGGAKCGAYSKSL